MFTSQLVTGLLLGIDSFLVCLALGALPQRTVRRSTLSLSFGLCDGCASWIGSLAGMEALRSALPRSEWLGPAAAAAYGLYLLALACRSRDLTTDTRPARLLTFTLPVCLSLDNLVTSLATPASGAPPVLAALALGAISGELALLGLAAGSVLARRSRVRAQWVAGCLLLIATAGLVLTDNLGDWIARN